MVLGVSSTEATGLIGEETKVLTCDDDQVTSAVVGVTLDEESSRDVLPTDEPEFYYTFSPSALATSPSTMTPPHLVEETSIRMDKDLYGNYDSFTWESPYSDTEELFPELN